MRRDYQIWFGDSETKRFNAVETVEVGGVVWENPDVWRKRDDYCSEMGKYWNSTSLHKFNWGEMNQYGLEILKLNGLMQ